MSRTWRIEYVGGPIDGHVADVPEEHNSWSRYTDPETGLVSFYHLEYRDEGPRFVFQPQPLEETVLLELCNRHFARTRRVVTTIAVPPGTIESLRDRLRAERRYDPDKPVPVLYTPGGVVTFEELEGLSVPRVLSDTEWRPG